VILKLLNFQKERDEPISKEFISAIVVVLHHLKQKTYTSQTLDRILGDVIFSTPPCTSEQCSKDNMIQSLKALKVGKTEKDFLCTVSRLHNRRKQYMGEINVSFMIKLLAALLTSMVEDSKSSKQRNHALDSLIKFNIDKDYLDSVETDIDDLFDSSETIRRPTTVEKIITSSLSSKDHNVRTSSFELIGEICRASIDASKLWIPVLERALFAEDIAIQNIVGALLWELMFLFPELQWLDRTDTTLLTQMSNMINSPSLDQQNAVSGLTRLLEHDLCGEESEEMVSHAFFLSNDCSCVYLYINIALAHHL
jgi:hypothetical protein